VPEFVRSSPSVFPLLLHVLVKTNFLTASHVLVRGHVNIRLQLSTPQIMFSLIFFLALATVQSSVLCLVSMRQDMVLLCALSLSIHTDWPRSAVNGSALQVLVEMLVKRCQSLL
jgi:hypothetical protein